MEQGPVKAIDPNDPDVYTNPDKVRLLDLTSQMIATINMARTGQIVNGNEILTLEAIMSAAGYHMTMDGKLSSEEQAFLKNFKDKLEDKNFKETAVVLLKEILDNPQTGVPVLGKPAAPDVGASFGMATRTRAIQKLAQLIADPD